MAFRQRSEAESGDHQQEGGRQPRRLGRDRQQPDHHQHSLWGSRRRRAVTSGTRYLLQDNRVISNTATAGGGVAVYTATGSIVHNQVISNLAVRGGGMYVWGTAQPTLDGNAVMSNTALGLVAAGGGVLVPRWERGCLYLPNGQRERMEPAEALMGRDVLLLSREWARLSSNRQVALSAPVWDLVLLDEAHAARRSAQEEREFNSGNLLLQLLRELQLRRRARSILLLSATPTQTQPWEPWDLLSVLGIGGRRVVEFSDVRMYYQGAAGLLARR